MRSSSRLSRLLGRPSPLTARIPGRTSVMHRRRGLVLEHVTATAAPARVSSVARPPRHGHALRSAPRPGRRREPSSTAWPATHSRGRDRPRTDVSQAGGSSPGAPHTASDRCASRVGCASQPRGLGSHASGCARDTHAGVHGPGRSVADAALRSNVVVKRHSRLGLGDLLGPGPRASPRSLRVQSARADILVRTHPMLSASLGRVVDVQPDHDGQVPPRMA